MQCIPFLKFPDDGAFRRIVYENGANLLRLKQRKVSQGMLVQPASISRVGFIPPCGVL